MDFNLILKELNLKTGKNFSIEDFSTLKMMRELEKQGFNDADLIAVIQKKCDDWAGTEYEQYLRPLTLFGQKFKQYHEQQSLSYFGRIQNAVDAAESASWNLDKK